MAYLALVLVLLNAVVSVAHGVAHRDLGVSLSAWQQTFVYGVMAPGPFVALLLLRRHARDGYALLFVSMLASLLFGAYHHYGPVSPDHVAHLPPGDSQSLFRLTAAGMVIVQGAGALVGALGLGGTGRTVR